ncbi:hypothetical protein F5Y01DRAFT_284810 [Xylaria sp. FL0043]|nr:hypothetical protein F5Y01DRAFT_284810 [Xylaria sp. FL0043]
MEAVGTAAALTELLSLSIKVSKAAKGLVESFINAPEELIQLVAKLGHLQSRIEQLHGLSEDLSAANLAVLLTPELHTVLSAGLQTNFHALQTVESLCNARSGKPQTVGTRWRWAMFDKKKAARILEKIAKAESELSVMLAILGVRLTSLNQISLGALNASHAVLHAGLRESTESVKEWIHLEIKELIGSGPVKSARTTTIASNDGLQRLANGVDMRSLSLEIDANRSKPLEKKIPDMEEEEDDDRADPSVRLLEHYMRKSRNHRAIAFGSLHQLCTTNRPAVGASLTAQSKRNRQKLRAVLEFGFNLFCQHILQFELTVQQVARGWVSMPRLNCSMTIFNVRPTDAPIFQACRDRNIGKVRYLLESGEASVHDADDEIGGLLEHAMHGGHEHWSYASNRRELYQIQQLVEHLLDQGCDPNAFYGPLHENRLPAMLFAFHRGYSSSLSAMLSRGADISNFDWILAGFLQNVNAGFQWKVKILRSMGYSDWKSESRLGVRLSDTILHGACGAADLQELLFALEIAGLAPNLEGRYKQTPLWIAAAVNFLKGAAVLIEYGAVVNPSEVFYGGTPLARSFSSSQSIDVAHYLLLQGADPQLKPHLHGSAWHLIWNAPSDMAGEWPDTWSFIRLEGVLAHLLLHGSDPFELFEQPDTSQQYYPSYHFHPPELHLRAPEIARSWSYGIRRQAAHETTPEEWIVSFEDAEQTRTPRFDFRWSWSGLVYQGLSGQDRESPQDTEGGRTLLSTSGRVECDSLHPDSKNTMNHVADSPAEQSAECRGTDSQSSSDGREDQDNRYTFFGRQTQFYHHISSAKGRRQLTRFPMALALCDALQYAGYRAEMDDDGDIWYDIEDGDRYFDAQENHVTEPLEDCAADLCPICQDFEGYGLGHILREVEEAKREVWEYKKKVRATRHYF